jgi:hypothetical protein
MTAIATPRLGKNSKLYRNTGTWATPALATLNNCKGVKIPMSYGEDDVSARITNGVEAIVTTLLKYGLQFEMFGDDGPDWVAIRTAFFAQTPVEMFIFNGLATDITCKGVRITMTVVKFEESQENDKANHYDVELKPTWPDPTSTAGTASAIIGATTWTIAS